MSPPRVAVIGRGIGGLTSCIKLVDAGFHVISIAKQGEDTVASRAGIGANVQKGVFDARTPLFAAKCRGHATVPTLLAGLEQRARYPIERSFEGAFEPFASEAEYKAKRQRVYHDQFGGLFGLEVRPTEDLLAQGFEPSVYRGSIGSLRYPGDGWYSAQDWLSALERVVARDVESYITGTVAAAVQDGNGWRLRVGDQSLVCDGVLLAAGPGSLDLLKSLSIDSLGFRVVSGTTVEFDNPGLRPGVYVNQAQSLVIRQNRIVFGPIDHDTTDRYAFLCNLEAVFDLPAPTNIVFRSGGRVRTSDRVPVAKLLEGVPCFGLLTGFYRNGFQLVDEFSERVVQQIQSALLG